MYLNLITLPLVLFLLFGIFGRKLGIQGVYKLSIISLVFLLLLSISLVYEVVLDNNPITYSLSYWLKEDLLLVEFKFLLDDLSSTMLTVVLSISLIVLIYSYDYMIEDPHLIRFFTYIILFIFCMIILITTSSLPILFIGWEGVGVTSFLLISFWYTRIESNLGSLLAIFMNRIGDLFFLLGLFFSLFLIASLDAISLITTVNINMDYLIISFLIAAMAKSAQLYLHIWLPYSMEGPTPISALIHAATMVTAGVFLLLRLSLLISYSYYSLVLILIIGALTLFVGGTLAITSLDIKELIAYSTMSQLGYMITILGLKYSNLSYFHLIYHAYFKALLFLTAGSIIHTILDQQDLRFLGSLYSFLPISYSVIFIGLTSLGGIPFTTGFYSKEAIINSSFSYNHFLGSTLYLMTLLTAFLTSAYSLKFILQLFFKTTNLSLFVLKHLHFYSFNLTISLSLLSFFTIFIGYLFSKFFYIFNLPINFYYLNMPTILKLLPLIFFILFFFFYLNYSLSSSLQFNILTNQYNFKILYQFIGGTFLSLSYRIFFKIFDYGFIDLMAPLFSIQIFNVSQSISYYLNPKFYFPLLIFFLFLFVYLF